MIKTSKGNMHRPNLVIKTQDFNDANDYQKDQVYKNAVFLKPLRSEKNLHEIKQFSFEQANIRIISADRKSNQLHQLEKDKTELIHSLKVLKEGAVQAIGQKLDEIQKLKSKNSFNSDQTFEYYENQLQISRRMLQELEQERDELRRQMSEERSKYIVELEQKEEIIQSLYEQIQQIRRELQRLEQTDLLKKQKIKQLRQENIQLSVQLELSNLPTRRSEKPDLDQTNRFVLSNSILSSVANHSLKSIIQSDHLFQSESDKLYMSQILDEMDRMHRQEINELKQIYQKKIMDLKEINQIELKMRLEQSQREKQSMDYKSVSASNSSKMIDTYNLPIQDTNEINLNLNYEMYSIEQKVQHQLETSRQDIKNLKYQIQVKNLSQCPSLEPYANNNQDNQSQFTIKHFQFPYRFIKHNLSNDNLNFEDRDVKPVEQNKSVCPKQQLTDTQGKARSFNWQKTGIFAVGLFSGITLTSLVGILIKKL